MRSHAKCVVFEYNSFIGSCKKDSFGDFEDCLQDKCAKEVGADYIIAVNEKDFANSEIEAINPCKFLEIWKSNCRGQRGSA